MGNLDDPRNPGMGSVIGHNAVNHRVAVFTVKFTKGVDFKLFGFNENTVEIEKNGLIINNGYSAESASVGTDMPGWSQRSVAAASVSLASTH